MDTINLTMLVIGYVVSFSVVGAAVIVFIAWVIPLALGRINHVRNVVDLFDKLRRQESELKTLRVTPAEDK